MGLANATYNFKPAEITRICLIKDQTFANTGLIVQ